MGKNKGKRWTEEEVELLKEFVEGGKTVEYMANRLNRTKGAVYMRKSSEGFYSKKKEPWTEEEVNFLKDNYTMLSDEELARRLNRTANAVQIRRSIEGFVNFESKSWTNKELMKLSTLYWEGKSDEFIAKELGRTLNSTQQNRRMLGLNRKIERKEHEYALYDGDEYIAQGTVGELSAKSGLSEVTLELYRYPSYRSKTSKRLIRVDELDSLSGHDRREKSEDVLGEYKGMLTN